MKEKVAQRIKQTPAWVWWLAGFLLAQAACVCLVYYWRVFYSYGLYPLGGIGAGALTAAVCGVCAVLTGIAYGVHRFCRSFTQKAAAALLCAGLLFCFANPPLQSPDEASHYLRAYSVSRGHLNFDYERGYPDDVNALEQAFPAAWVNANNGHALKVQADEQGNVKTAGVWQAFDTYRALRQSGKAAQNKEPIIFLVLPFLPSALAMTLVRLCGGGALACLYAGRIGSLLAYTFLCVLALRKARRYHSVLLAFMLMPLGVYMASSVSYEGIILGFTWVLASYFCADEIHSRDLLLIMAGVAMMSAVKIVNILWMALPFLLPQSAWKCKTKKWQAALAVFGLSVCAFLLFSWYGTAFRVHYPVIGRTLGDTVNQAEQIKFVLSNPLRFLAVIAGTLYENGFFIFRMGLFGGLDMPIEAVSALSAGVTVLAAALGADKKSTLPRRNIIGLLLFALAYAGAVCAGLYITYTPVGMVRIIGLQPRYFLPAAFLLAVLLSSALSYILRPALQKDAPRKAALAVCAGLAVCSAVLLFQHYFVGPVWVYGI